MSAHKLLGWFQTRWLLTKAVDKRPYFEACLVFQADNMDEAEAMFDRMTDALGCSDETCGEDKPCPHFRVGGLHLLDERSQ